MTGTVTAARADSGDRRDAYFEVVPVPDGDAVDSLPLDGDDIGALGLDDPGLDAALPLVRSDVDGDADGVPVPRSLLLPDGPWLQPVARAAMSENAKTPLSTFFMSTPPAEFGPQTARQAKCRRRPGGRP